MINEFLVPEGVGVLDSIVDIKHRHHAERISHPDWFDRVTVNNVSIFCRGMLLEVRASLAGDIRGVCSVEGISEDKRELFLRAPTGTIPGDLLLFKSKINPWHLEPVTHIENQRRGKRGEITRTHCMHGHALEGDNLVRVMAKGSLERRCRMCLRAADARRREKARQVRGSYTPSA